MAWRIYCDGVNAACVFDGGCAAAICRKLKSMGHMAYYFGECVQ